MDYSEIKKYDCGSKIHPRFPTQQKVKVNKPLFREVIQLAEDFTRKQYQTIYYNVEIKSAPEGDSLFHPPVELFSDLVCQLIQESGIKNRTIVQSFDLRALQYIRENHQGFTLSLLIENLVSPEKNLEELGFTPEIYSPYFHLVDSNLINLSRSKGMKVIPWTVNTAEEIQQMIDLGVDGIITDYPDIFV
jgi:glycerophosphoryl diester phosphodiesterase